MKRSVMLLLVFMGAPIIRAQDVSVYGVIDPMVTSDVERPVFDEQAMLTQKADTAFGCPNLSLGAQGQTRWLAYQVQAAFPDAQDVEVRNAWLQIDGPESLVQVRAGLVRRRFGLYNALLDISPLYNDLWAPSYLNPHHLAFPRTTKLMVFGQVGDDASTVFKWALQGGNDESPASFQVSGDARVIMANGLTLGTSLYHSLTAAKPSEDVAVLTQATGRLPWMDEDRYVVTGGYAQWQSRAWTVQTEVWTSEHQARRNPERILAMKAAGLTDSQLSRLGWAGASQFTEEEIRGRLVEPMTFRTLSIHSHVDYTGQTQSITWTPFLSYGYTAHPEWMDVRFRDGLADEGQFHTVSGGFVVRPMKPLAVKASVSATFMEINQQRHIIPVMGVQVGYVWALMRD